MQTVHDLLDALRTRAGSDRKAAPLVGVTQASFSEWRRSHGYPDDERARRIAELLQLDPAYVLAIIHGERAKSKETRAAWRRVAEAFGKAAALAVVAVGTAGTPSPAPAAPAGDPMYIMLNRRRRPPFAPALARLNLPQRSLAL